jgi:hypothetical protein
MRSCTAASRIGIRLSHARDQQELIVHETTAQIAGINAAAERDIAIEMILRSEKREFTPEERKALDAAQAKLKEARTRLDEPTIRVTQVFERHADELERLWRRAEALRRSMFRALHELQRLQALRAGEACTAASRIGIRLGASSSRKALRKASNSSGSSLGRTNRFPVSPCLRAFEATRAFPSQVRGPVLC